MSRLTDQKAIRTALFIAIDTEESLIEAYGGEKSEAAVQNAEKNIAAFQRVLDRYYAGARRKKPSSGKIVSILSLMTPGKGNTLTSLSSDEGKE